MPLRTCRCCLLPLPNYRNTGNTGQHVTPGGNLAVHSHIGQTGLRLVGLAPHLEIPGFTEKQCARGREAKGERKTGKESATVVAIIVIFHIAPVPRFRSPPKDMLALGCMPRHQCPDKCWRRHISLEQRCVAVPGVDHKILASEIVRTNSKCVPTGSHRYERCQWRRLVVIIKALNVTRQKFRYVIS